MPPYSLIHLENVWWVLAGGLVFAAAIVLARGSRAFTFTIRKRSDKALDDSGHEFGDGLKEENRPMPLLIWLVFIGYFVWAVLYVIFSAGRGL